MVDYLMTGLILKFIFRAENQYLLLHQGEGNIKVHQCFKIKRKIIVINPVLYIQV